MQHFGFYMSRDSVLPSLIELRSSHDVCKLQPSLSLPPISGPNCRDNKFFEIILIPLGGVKVVDSTPIHITIQDKDPTSSTRAFLNTCDSEALSDASCIGACLFFPFCFLRDWRAAAPRSAIVLIARVSAS